MHGIDDQPAIDVRGLSVAYGHVAAVDDITFHLDAGELVALVGPNGAGKSTLMRTLLGLQRFRGAAVVHGRTAFVPQRAEVDLDFPITLMQLVLCGRRRFRRGWQRSRAVDRQAAARALSRVGLDGLESRTLRELSGGQVQLGLIARALAAEADVLLLDEPLVGVDAGTSESLCDLFAALAADGSTVVVSSHDLNLVRRRFRRCLALNRQLVCDDDPAEALSGRGLERLFLAAA